MLCVLFARKDNLGKFVCEKFAAHNSKQYYQMALTQMDALKSSIAHPESSIENRLQRTSETDIATNRYIIKCMAEAILFGRI